MLKLTAEFSKKGEENWSDDFFFVVFFKPPEETARRQIQVFVFVFRKNRVLDTHSFHTKFVTRLGVNL